MSTQLEDQAPVEDNIEPIKDDQVELETPARDQAEIDAEAKRQGWIDKDEFNKDAGEWRSAEEFLKRSETEGPITRARLKSMDKRLKGMEVALEFQKKDNERREADIRLEEESKYRERLRGAAETGDIDEYDRIDRERIKKVDIPKTDPEDPRITVFKSDNDDWFGIDEDMTDFALAAFDVGIQKHPTWDLDMVLRATKSKVVTAYPRKFTNNSSSVEGGTRRMPQPASRARTFDSMPQDSREGFDACVRAGLVKNDDQGRDHFAEIYWEDKE